MDTCLPISIDLPSEMGTYNKGKVGIIPCRVNYRIGQRGGQNKKQKASVIKGKKSNSMEYRHRPMKKNNKQAGAIWMRQ